MSPAGGHAVDGAVNVGKHGVVVLQRNGIVDVITGDALRGELVGDGVAGGNAGGSGDGNANAAGSKSEGGQRDEEDHSHDCRDKLDVPVH